MLLNICPTGAAFEPAFVSHFVAFELAARVKQGGSGSGTFASRNFVQL
jgi:hypothetical protein